MTIRIKLIIGLLIIIFYLICKYMNILRNEIIFFKTNKNKIKLAIFSRSIKNGGVERQTSLMLHYFNKVKIFDLFLFTLKHKEENEYKIDANIKRIVIKRNLFQILIENNIEILIYQFYKVSEIKKLNNLKNTKTIFINRSCFLHWIYYNKLYFFNTVYKTYRQCKYLISLVPFENNLNCKKMRE